MRNLAFNCHSRCVGKKVMKELNGGKEEPAYVKIAIR